MGDSKLNLRKWQSVALKIWIESGYKGIIGVVTGGGKTIFALACINAIRPRCTIIVVPTIPLLEQWWEEAAYFFDLKLDEINILQGRNKPRTGTINICVLNSASKILPSFKNDDTFLIVDECHKAASPEFSNIFNTSYNSSLGLSATPERPYDDGLLEILSPKLGPVIYTYDYIEAMRDKIIVPFELKNVVFKLEKENEEKYSRLTKRIAQLGSQFGFESDEAVSAMLQRSRVLNMSLRRIEVTLSILSKHVNDRVIVFHESIEACKILAQALLEYNVKVGLYHSDMKLKNRAQILHKFRNNEISILVACRALDEGFNVPEANVAIIAASTATARQRIQRLGRVLRPAPNKEKSTIYTLVCSEPEISRLRKEESELQEIASIQWANWK